VGVGVKQISPQIKENHTGFFYLFIYLFIYLFLFLLLWHEYMTIRIIHLWVNYPFKEKAVCVKASVKVSELPTPKLACGATCYSCLYFVWT